MELESPSPKTTIFTKAIFLLFGIGALLAYNAFLTELPFFEYFLEDLSPAKTIPFLNFVLNITFQFLILWKKNLFKLKNQLLIGLICSIIFLILIPIVVAKFGKNSMANMVTTSILILIMGFINALLTSGFYSLASFFPLECVVSLNSGMAIAGILMNLIQYFVIPFFDMEDHDDIVISALIFFSISGFILLVCLIFLLIQWKTDYYQYYLRSLYNNEEMKNMKLESISSEKNEILELETEKKEVEKKELSFMEMFKILRYVDLLGMFIYIVTASLYPNAMISQQLYNIEEKYNVNTILIIINTCDTIGRYSVSKLTPSIKLAAIVILSRTILIISVLLNYYFQKKKEPASIEFTGSFLLFNIIALAISNGIGTSLCFGIAPTLVEDEYKGQAGASVSFFATLGTFTGTILAYLTSYIMSLLEYKK